MEIDLKDITKMGDEIERLTTEASELKETISILTQLNEQKTDDRYDDWAFSEDGYMRRGKALRVENERLQARVETLANFNPDWDMLEATQESLREHMQIIRKLNDGIEGLTRANEALIETNKELTTEAREAFAAGFKARHETPDINRAWEDWYTRQNTDSGNQCSHEWCDIATGGQYCRLCDARRPEYEGMAYDD